MRRDRLLLGAAGAAMLLTQHVAVREIGSTFFSTELVLLFATIVTLAGPSVGYAVAHRISPRALAVWGAVSVAAQIALPVGLRALAGAMAARGYEGLALGATAAIGGLLLSGFYAVFLPRLARAPASLADLYATELAGALVALAALAASPSYRVTLALYWAVPVLVLFLGLVPDVTPPAADRELNAKTQRREGAKNKFLRIFASLRPLRLCVQCSALAAAIAALATYPRLDRWAAAVYYEGYHGRRAPSIVETAHSAYQRIDVIDDARGRRSLYLDGVPFFRSGGADAFNALLAGLPGALLTEADRDAAGPPRAALVVGSGSFSSAARLHRLGYDVTVVEVDAAVARVGFARFASMHGLRPGDVRVVIDDGRRYLATTGAAFDLIAMDVPAPYHVRTALLHTPRFYRLAASRLRPGGVLSLSLCGGASSDVGRAIAASAAEVFPSIAAVEGGASGIALLYAGAPLPFTPDQIAAALARDPAGGRVHTDAEVRAGLRGAAPLSEERLAPVLALARAELEESFRAR